jgi:CHASE2 domain-containing sensor protein
MIGADYDRRGWGQEIEHADLHESPVGNIPGVVLHANYVEAMLYQRDFPAINRSMLTLIECALVFALAWVLFSDVPFMLKVLLVVALITSPIWMSYFSIHNFGIYFDFFVINLMLIGHIVVEHILGWRKDALKYRHQLPTT